MSDEAGYLEEDFTPQQLEVVKAALQQDTLATLQVLEVDLGALVIEILQTVDDFGDTLDDQDSRKLAAARFACIEQHLRQDLKQSRQQIKDAIRHRLAQQARMS